MNIAFSYFYYRRIVITVMFIREIEGLCVICDTLKKIFNFNFIFKIIQALQFTLLQKCDDFKQPHYLIDPFSSIFVRIRLHIYSLGTFLSISSPFLNS